MKKQKMKNNSSNYNNSKVDYIVFVRNLIQLHSHTKKLGFQSKNH